jgi:hypothetical protein
MSTHTANAAAASAFRAAATVVAVRGPDGRVLGLYSPGADEAARLYLDAWLSLDPAAANHSHDPGERTYSFAEVKARIGMGDVP